MDQYGYAVDSHAISYPELPGVVSLRLHMHVYGGAGDGKPLTLFSKQWPVNARLVCFRQSKTIWTMSKPKGAVTGTARR